MTVLARPPRASRAATAGPGERDQLGRIPRDLWEALAADEDARARYYGKVYWRGPGQCAYFLGALSSGGHGRFRAGTRRAAADRPGSLVVPADNSRDYLARRADPYSPLSDRRGPRGRAVAIRGAILAALAEDASLGEIEAAIEAASAAGIPGAQQVLF